MNENTFNRLVEANARLQDKVKFCEIELERVDNKVASAIKYMEKKLGRVVNNEFEAFGDLDYAQDEIENLYKLLKDNLDKKEIEEILKNGKVNAIEII